MLGSYRWFEWGAVASVLCLLIIATLFAFGDVERVREAQKDAVRNEDVRQLMQAAVTLVKEDPEAFSELAAVLADDVYMIGSGERCGGPSTVDVCADDMPCIDVQETLGQHLDQIPSDPLMIEYSHQSTGYYLTMEAKTLVIGSCIPQQQGEIELRYRF